MPRISGEIAEIPWEANLAGTIDHRVGNALQAENLRLSNNLVQVRATNNDVSLVTTWAPSIDGYQSPRGRNACCIMKYPSVTHPLSLNCIVMRFAHKNMQPQFTSAQP
uniref:Uncharacterized protein n=1 Tax=Eutreptiella gymnastica TaxID=73025 RepID=A0A7S4LQL2_9EUGL